MSTIAPVALADRQPGLAVAMGGGQAPIVSNTWHVGGWAIQFVRLDAHQRHALDLSAGRVYVKVITGRLSNIARSAYPEPKVIRHTQVDQGHVEADAQGALFALFTETAAVPERVASMHELTVRGPHAEVLRWQSFEARYRAVTPFFNGLDPHRPQRADEIPAAGAHPDR